MNEFQEATNISTCECVVDDSYQVCTNCLICGDSVPVGLCGPHIRVCDKCKSAVMYIRKNMENT